jgi:hypothetical protein
VARRRPGGRAELDARGGPGGGFGCESLEAALHDGQGVIEGAAQAGAFVQQSILVGGADGAAGHLLDEHEDAAKLGHLAARFDRQRLLLCGRLMSHARQPSGGALKKG